MNARSEEISKKLKEARHEMSCLVEDIGTVLMHLREGIEDADHSEGICAELCASDALEVLTQIETKITDIQNKVATCTL